jgi:uncharacterized membrane protein YcjF (UPF0283 family)
MGDTHHDPVDHSRTHNQHAGESMIDVYFWPGFFLLAGGVLAVFGCLAAAAYQHHEWLLTTAVIAVVAFAAGSAWIALEHRRVRRVEARWLADHPVGHPHRHAA